MDSGERVPDDVLGFIQRCIRERKVYWTYHVNMRLAGRHLTRDEILGAVDGYEIIESYPDDKYLPSYLVWASQGGGAFHILFAIDAGADRVSVVTAYRPDPSDWESDMKTRKPK